MCNKLTYFRRDAARHAARRYRRALNERIAAYYCATCRGWHVGHHNRRDVNPYRRHQRHEVITNG